MQEKAEQHLTTQSRKLRWAMGKSDAWTGRGSLASSPRRGLTHLAAQTGTLLRADLKRELQLIGFNTDRAAVQLGVSLSWGAAAQDREKWRKLAARLPLAPVPVETKHISEEAHTERTQSEHAQLAPDPAATTWSQRLRSRGSRGTIPYHTISLDHPSTRVLQMKHTLKAGDETNARRHGSLVNKFDPWRGAQSPTTNSLLSSDPPWHRCTLPSVTRSRARWETQSAQSATAGWANVDACLATRASAPW
jgi:hypothetical protein